MAGYGEYLRSVREKGSALGGISIFSRGGFALRNIEKSAADHAALTSKDVRWIPSAPAAAVGSVWTDIPVILLTFLFTGILVTDERQKGLSGVVRATRRGVTPCVCAKLAALFINCLALEAVFFTGNILFSGIVAGWWDVTARLQSVSLYMESALDVSVLEFYALCAAVKALGLFAAFTFIAALCSVCGSITTPFISGAALWTGSWAIWRFVPAASKVSSIKYLNLFALLRTEDIFGGYLNLDIGGRPVSRMGASIVMAAALAAGGAALTVALQWRGVYFARRKVHSIHSRFRPHASPLRHEAYKLLIAQRGLAVLALFSCLIAAGSLSAAYAPSPGERYYRDIMLSLEGELTGEKTALIEAERARFDSAFEEIRRIDADVASGIVSAETGEAMKAKWQAVTSFYPEFKRVDDQYELICSSGGSFIYDTGWLYLLGELGPSELGGFLLVTLGIVLAFSNAGAVEFSSGAWSVIRPSPAGGRMVIITKAAVCVLASAALAAVPLISRYICVNSVFPIRCPLAPARVMDAYRSLPAFVPVSALAGGKLLLQGLCGAVTAGAVLGISLWQKNHVRAVFCALALLLLPCLMSALGFTFGEKLSLYPIYSLSFG